jgi:hypothetical protein
MTSNLDRRALRTMVQRWTDDEKWDGRPTEDLLVRFGSTVARQVRRKERSGRVLEHDAERAADQERHLILRFLNHLPDDANLREAAAALVRREHRR